MLENLLLQDKMQKKEKEKYFERITLLSKQRPSLLNADDCQIVFPHCRKTQIINYVG